MKERKFETQLRKKLRKIPYSWWVPKQLSITIRGIPDIIGCIKGDFVALECKRSLKDSLDKTPTTELQKHNIRSINNAWGNAWFVYPENEEMILKRLYEK